MKQVYFIISKLQHHEKCSKRNCPCHNYDTILPPLVGRSTNQIVVIIAARLRPTCHPSPSRAIGKVTLKSVVYLEISVLVQPVPHSHFPRVRCRPQDHYRSGTRLGSPQKRFWTWRHEDRYQIDEGRTRSHRVAVRQSRGCSG